MAENGSNFQNNDTLVKEEANSPAFGNSVCNGVNRNNSRYETTENDTNQCSDDSVDCAPLDFSLKKERDDDVTCSETASSPTSTNDSQSNSHIEEKKHELEERVNLMVNGLLHAKDNKNGRIGEPQTGPMGGMSGMAVPPAMSHMLSMFPGGFVPNVNMLRSFPGMAALMDPRQLQQLQGNKGGRPFKTFPKDPGGFDVFGHQGFPNTPPPIDNNSVLQSLNLSTEELLNIYKQQAKQLQEREKWLEQFKTPSRPRDGPTQSPSASQGESSSNITNSFVPNGARTPTSTPTTPTLNPATPPILSSSYSPSMTQPHLHSHYHHSSARRKRPRSLPDDQKDEAYWDRRRKNNEAAKRSRDQRRAKEDQIAIRAALLEQENLKLRVEVAALKSETAKLRCMLYNS